MPRRKSTDTPVHAIGEHCTTHEVLDFKVSSFDETACTIAEFQERHRHDFFEIIWLKNGAGVHQIDLQDHPYQGSVVFVLSPGQIHRIAPSKKSDGYVLKFRPAALGTADDFADLMLETFISDPAAQLSPVIPIAKNLTPQLDELFSTLSDEFNGEQRDSHHIVAASLRILITQLSRLRRQRHESTTLAADPQHALYRTFRLLLERHHRAEHAVQSYARLASASVKQLNRATRTFAGKSVGEMIADRLVLEARRELYHGDGSIKSLAYGLGFTDPAYFTRFFKKQTSESPQEFRSRMMSS